MWGHGSATLQAVNWEIGHALAFLIRLGDRDPGLAIGREGQMGVAIAQAHKLSDLPVPGASLGCLAVGVCYVAQV